MGEQALLAFTTLMVRVRMVPALPSRMSARMKSDSDGKGPAVSEGVTAQLPLVLVVPPVAEPPSLAPVGESPPQPKASAAPATPSAPSASRRPIALFIAPPRLSFGTPLYRDDPRRAGATALAAR